MHLMLKYVNYDIVFQEIPNETTLAINVSNCPCHCKGCHSSYLAEDIGNFLDLGALMRLIDKNEGITCVAFMGGDSDPQSVSMLAGIVQTKGLLTAWYSGRQELSKDIELSNFDFIKLGPYKEEFGPLNSRATNQRFYKVSDRELINITSKFWKHETEN